MIYTEEVLQLEEEISQLAKAIVESSLTQTYTNALVKMNRDMAVLAKKQAFLAAKNAYEQIADYGTYAPDHLEKKQALYQAKRQFDLDETVAEFRFQETALQTLLDQIGTKIAQTISEDIKVDAGNPFFEMANKGCGGGCHHG